jgi:hypothetical protein
MLAMMFPPPIADMLLNAYAAAVGRPAMMTSTIPEITDSPARSFHRWAMNRAGEFGTPP